MVMPFFKKYRKQLKLSQHEIAESLDTTQTMVSKIERGQLYGRYFVAYLTLLAQKGVDVNEFFLSEEAKRDYSGQNGQ